MCALARDDARRGVGASVFGSHAPSSLLSLPARGHQARPGRRRRHRVDADRRAPAARPGQRGDDARARPARGREEAERRGKPAWHAFLPDLGPVCAGLFPRRAEAAAARRGPSRSGPEARRTSSVLSGVALTSNTKRAPPLTPCPSHIPSRVRLLHFHPTDPPHRRPAHRPRRLKHTTMEARSLLVLGRATAAAAATAAATATTPTARRLAWCAPARLSAAGPSAAAAAAPPSPPSIRRMFSDRAPGGRGSVAAGAGAGAGPGQEVWKRNGGEDSPGALPSRTRTPAHR